MAIADILVNGQWMASNFEESFQAVNPATGEAFGREYPVSTWADLEAVLEAASKADEIVRDWSGDRFAEFLENYADRIEANADEISEIAHLETAYPISPRLKQGELPRTVNQLRLAATAAREGEWATPVVDAENNICSVHRSLGPILLFGPNNFPLAYNGISGGDFAAAIAAGNPVIAKGHPSHPGTTLLFAKLALQSVKETGFPDGFVQLVYHMQTDDGIKMIKDFRVAGVGFTGAQSSGLKIKAAADEMGKPVYLELSSINPVFVFPGSFDQKSEEILSDFTASCLMGSGQFCTNPGIVVLPPHENVSAWIDNVQKHFAGSQCGSLLSENVRDNFLTSVNFLAEQGAQLLTGGAIAKGGGFTVQSTLLQCTAKQFLEAPEVFQQEAFGCSSLIVTTQTVEQMVDIASTLEGQLTGSVYLSGNEADNALYTKLEPVLRRKVGRLLNNKMPTGVAVSPAMNHGGPFPATGHPGFTAVGMPASLRRFSMLQCYDNIPNERLPEALKT